MENILSIGLKASVAMTTNPFSVPKVDSVDLNST